MSNMGWYLEFRQNSLGFTGPLRPLGLGQSQSQGAHTEMGASLEHYSRNWPRPSSTPSKLSSQGKGSQE